MGSCYQLFQQLNQYLVSFPIFQAFFLSMASMAHFSTPLLSLLLLCSLLQGSEAAAKDVLNFVINSHLGGGNFTESKVNCIWRNETGGGSSNVSSLSSTVYCLGSSAPPPSSNFAPIFLMTLFGFNC